jgi:glycosyltransferase involved in cell wall biosynthesis
MVSIVIPGYNEEALITRNLTIICMYMKDLESAYDWELIFVNDGSKDKTGEMADEFAAENPNVRVIHHPVNLNLGNALKTGFEYACGDYVITLDLDLSYAPDHIGRILDTLAVTRADMVLASPYMKGGKVTAVPFIRELMSRWANHFMRFAAQEKFHTFTCMVRGYRAGFLRTLNLKTKNYEINPEILYKAMILRARIIEIPAHLDWTEQNKIAGRRTSGMKFLWTIISSLMAGFIFRPYIFFMIVGFILLILALYMITWIFINTFRILPTIAMEEQFFDDRFSYAIGIVFKEHPHAFMVSGFTLLAAIQILSLSFIALQNKRYFEELFHLNTHVLKEVNK